jgi:energy-coupling factor transporter ATP-binding protein EcfA2/WD40 repeat protein
MEAISSSIKSPFQLFTAFSENDRDKFFGRDEEVGKLYQLVQEANVVLVYGESGTGKTSLVQCGLLNETKHFNWTSIKVRRIENINLSLEKKLQENITDTSLDDSNDTPVTKLLQEVFINSFQPILLIFDQFEELYVLGDEKERQDFYNNIEEILSLKVPIKTVFVIREEFIARLTEFEKVIPGIFKKRLRIELMDKSNCRDVIVKSCKAFEIPLKPIRMNRDGEPDRFYNSSSPDSADAIIDIVSNNQNLIHPPYLQVFLDTLWKEAYKLNFGRIEFDEALVEKVGNISDVLKAFIDEKVNSQEIISKVDAWKFLKTFVSESGTSRRKVMLNEYTALPLTELIDIAFYFQENKIITNCSEGVFELAHEILVPVIQKINITEIRSRLNEPTIAGNPYVGLKSFDEGDSDRFYGRREVIKTVYEKIKQNNFIVIAGNSGAGKSSLIKAGLFPKLRKDGFEILPTIKAGDNPLFWLEDSLSKVENPRGGKNYILLIDQYEELITRISDGTVRQAVYNRLHNLIEKQSDGSENYELKIIVTVRADFEPQFRIAQPLSEYWKKGKYIVPPFSKEEIREIIEEPAYQAGLEFSPPSLVDIIAEEVYGSQSTGLLPLMSFTLSELYKCYVNSSKNDNLLRAEDYEALGGVIGGLQKRAEKIYTEFEIKYPKEYPKYQEVMRNIVLRMIYFSAGELAGQRVLKEDLIFNDEEANVIKDKVLNELTDSHLIIEGTDNRKNDYIEPAHDVLVRAWGQVWDWIQNFTKDNLFLMGRLSQAVHDYNNDKNAVVRESFLWTNNAWLEDLEKVLRSKNNWLNKKEIEFVSKSIAQREAKAAASRKEQDEKIQLIEEKLLEQEEKSRLAEALRAEQEQKLQEEQEKKQLLAEKVEEQRKKVKRNKLVIGVISILFFIAIFFVFYAINQTQVASKNLVLATAAKNQAEKSEENALQSAEIAQKERRRATALNDQLKNALSEATRSEQLALINERIAQREKIRATQLADAERQNSLKINSLYTELQVALQQAKDSAQSAIASAKIAQEERDKANKALRTSDSLYRGLIAQQKQNVSQLLSLSKSLEKKDIIQAYRIAEIAYKKDTSNDVATNAYRTLSSQSKYFYWDNHISGDFSIYSPNGKFNLITSSQLKRVSISYNDSIRTSHTKPILFNLINAGFSPDSKTVMLTYEDHLEFLSVPELQPVSKINLKGDNVFFTAFSPNSTAVLVVTKAGLDVFDLSGKMIADIPNTGKDMIGSANFSEDGSRVVFATKSGNLFVYEITSGKYMLQPANGLFENGNAYLSSKGNFFIAQQNGKATLLNSFGKPIHNLSNLPKKRNYNLAAAIFSLDGNDLILRYTYFSQQQQQQQQQQTTIGNIKEYEDIVYHYDLKENSVTQVYNSNFLTLFKLYSFTVTPTTLFDNGFILFGQNDGLIRRFDVRDDFKEEVLAGNSELVTSMSVRHDRKQIMSSSKDGKTKMWVWDNAQNLERQGLLRRLSAEELKKLGVE